MNRRCGLPLKFNATGAATRAGCTQKTPGSRCPARWDWGTHLKNGWLLAKNQPSMGTGCHGSIQCDITMNENGGFTLQVGVAFLGGRGKGD